MDHMTHTCALRNKHWDACSCKTSCSRCATPRRAAPATVRSGRVGLDCRCPHANVGGGGVSSLRYSTLGSNFTRWRVPTVHTSTGTGYTKASPIFLSPETVIITIVDLFTRTRVPGTRRSSHPSYMFLANFGRNFIYWYSTGYRENRERKTIFR